MPLLAGIMEQLRPALDKVTRRRTCSQLTGLEQNRMGLGKAG
jgi:hypothetical protein